MAEGCTILAGGGGDATWKVASRAVASDLASHTDELQGYLECVPGRLQRRELPANQVVVILQFGEPIGVYSRAPTPRFERTPRAFVAGPDEQFSLTEFQRQQRGLQINLSLLGARQLFGVPMRHLQGQVVAFEDLVPGGALFLERLATAPDWPARFDLAESLLRTSQRVASTRESIVRWAVERVIQSGGKLDIGALSREVGYSHKYLIHLFREYAGLPPKRLAQLVRFERLTQALRNGRRPDASLAFDLGFADQAHLAREARRYSGLTPAVLSRHLTRA